MPCSVWRDGAYWVIGVVLNGVLNLTVGAVINVNGPVVSREPGEDGGANGGQLEGKKEEREDEGGFNRLPLPLQVNTHNEIKPS